MAERKILESGDTGQEQTRDRCLAEDFLAHFVHDLKTPVITIGGYAKRMRDGKLGEVSEDQKEALQIIVKSCERLEHDLKMILDHAVSEVVDRLSPKRYDLGTLLKRRVKGFGPQAEEKDIDLRFEGPSEPTMVYGDQTIVDKAVTNLIDNAIKYTDEGGWVKVRLSDIGDSVEIEVKDNGHGIEQEKIDLILRPFEQVMAIKDRELRGVGLGLSNVKRYVEMHHGELSVVSQPGNGSTFGIRLSKKLHDQEEPEIARKA